MSLGSIVIRISTNDGAVDWTVERPDQVGFRETLAAINQVLPQQIVQTFEYEDEDGDRITVRSDDEMITMITSYLGSGCDLNFNPLVIYPRVGRPSDKRNIHGLKIQTRDGSDMTSDSSQEAGSRKRSGDIKEILACGNVRDGDLQHLEKLGSGNCGTVYKTCHRVTGALIAVKVIPLDISYEAQKQILSELEILHRCNSPVIIGFHGAFFMENRISMCTEYMDGGSLDKYGQVETDVLGHVAVCVVKGLQYLWSLKIMHRDVKPSNILVNTGGQVKLCDFGVSVQLLDSVAKTFIGTNAYMAPERIKGQAYSIHSEVWSLGITLFELSSGRFPYESAMSSSAKPMDLFKSIVEKVPPRLPRGVFPESFVDFVSQCMQKDQFLRPAPHQLMRHPYIQQYSKSSSSVVAEWVRVKMEEFAFRDASFKTNSA